MAIGVNTNLDVQGDDDGDDADDVAKECGAGWDSGGELRAGGLWMEKALQGRPTTHRPHTKHYSIFHFWSNFINSLLIVNCNLQAVKWLRIALSIIDGK